MRRPAQLVRAQPARSGGRAGRHDGSVAYVDVDVDIHASRTGPGDVERLRHDVLDGAVSQDASRDDGDAVLAGAGGVLG